jgi:hypothetical protein
MEEVLKIGDTKLHSFDAYANFNANYKGFNLDAGVRMTDNSKFGNHWVYSVNPYYIKEFSETYFKIGYSLPQHSLHLLYIKITDHFHGLCKSRFKTRKTNLMKLI